jgi:exopolysaccharide biosynthesis protein
MEKYGAVNASSLDGGTSTAMYTEGHYINKPFNGYYPTFRWLPNAWIVK